MVMNLPLKQNDMGSILIACTMRNKKETKGTKAVRECRKKMANYTREQRQELQVRAIKLIDNSDKLKLKGTWKFVEAPAQFSYDPESKWGCSKEISESIKPLCLTCGHNRDMILHTDGNWYCHQTHRIQFNNNILI